MLVSICCLSYNHEKYISQALDSFLTQNSTYDFEIIIHDDCSSDGSPRLLDDYKAKYPQKVKIIQQKSNQYSQGKRVMYEYLFPEARGKYIAFCECDDYWVDPEKLNLQISYMEKNSDCSLTFTATNILNNDGSIQEFRPSLNDCDFSLAEIINYKDGALIPTATMVFRRDLVFDIPSYCWDAPIGDWPLSVYLASKGRVHYINKITSVYRYNHPGSWTRNHGRSDQVKFYREGMMACLKDMIALFQEPEKSLLIEKYNIQEYEYLIETGNVNTLLKKYKNKIFKSPIKSIARIVYRRLYPKY